MVLEVAGHVHADEHHLDAADETEPDDPAAIVRTLLGDLAPVDFDPDRTDVQIRYDDLYTDAGDTVMGRDVDDRAWGALQARTSWSAMLARRAPSTRGQLSTLGRITA